MEIWNSITPAAARYFRGCGEAQSAKRHPEVLAAENPAERACSANLRKGPACASAGQHQEMQRQCAPQSARQGYTSPSCELHVVYYQVV